MKYLLIIIIAVSFSINSTAQTSQGEEVVMVTAELGINEIRVVNATTKQLVSTFVGHIKATDIKKCKGIATYVFSNTDIFISYKNGAYECEIEGMPSNYSNTNLTKIKGYVRDYLNLNYSHKVRPTGF